MISFEEYIAQDRWSHVALAVALRGADLALRVPGLRHVMVDALLRRLGTAYEETEGETERMRHIRWLAPHLTAFLHRLIQERPAAARAALRFIATWIEDMYRRTDYHNASGICPCTVVIEPTDRCNLHCPGCYAKSSCDGSDLDYDRLAAIVEQVVDMGVSLITISGGEPFLRERSDRCLTRLAERFNNRAFLVYTNGTMIDEEIADRLGRVGNIFPAISVEGFEHQTDARRGCGVYEKNRRARALLAEHGVMTGFSATLTCQNAEAICTDRFLELRMAEGDLFGWFFLLQPIGRSPRTDLMVTSEQRALLRETIYRWRSEDRPIFLGDFWNDAHLVGGCIAGGRYYFHLYANGDISPCVFSPVSCGNIFDIIHGRSEYASLKDFVQRHPAFVAFRAEQDKIADRARPCLMMDHPEAFRRIYQMGHCQPAKNMAPGYLDGEIARALDAVAEEWRRHVPHLAPLPADMEASEAISRPGGSAMTHASAPGSHVH
jgi:MoaA/NifB/PqqE/SkfB family radical SAM enzyme